ncbi:MAG TPA: GspMb/PilO family protein [Longimicrobium sp.]
MSFLSSMTTRDRRALLLGGGIVILSLLFVAVRRGGEPGGVKEAIRTERAALARERGLVLQAGAFASALTAERERLNELSPRLFRGEDALAAASAVETYVLDAAERSRVAVRQSESRDAGPAGEGLTSLQVDLRGESDLRGVLSLVRALDSGARLVRVERLSIERAATGAPGDPEKLDFVLTAFGYAQGVRADTAPSASAERDSIAGADGKAGR